MSSSKYVCASLLAVAISLSVFVTLSVLDQAYAAKYPYKGQLSGKNEVPPVQTKATGEAEFTKVANATMKYRVNVTGISNATGAHIHMGKMGANGEVVADLLNTPTSKDKDTAYGMIIRGNISASSLKGPMQGKTLDDLATAIEKGDTYVNVHTTAHQNGEIRGQLASEAKPSSSGSTNSTNSTVGFSTLTE
jgi:CHRD domain